MICNLMIDIKLLLYYTSLFYFINVNNVLYGVQWQSMPTEGIIYGVLIL